MEHHYCEQCFELVESAQCPDCEASTRAVLDMDMVLLTTTNFSNVDMVAGMLKSFDIQVVVQSQYGHGFVMKAGPILESYRIFVPYAQYEKARELVDTAWV